MNNTRIIWTKSSDPWWNLAVEEYLLDRVEPGQCIFYLWQNENTIVIGRNQNPWRECRTELFESGGGKIARRLSGGGTVYHDSGNLNFTFIAGKGAYDLEKQIGVILEAVRSLGIKAEKSGRNDLTADGRKFSGNAFCSRRNGAFHHGTILISADFKKLSNYLQVSAEKMRSKGIQSVQSRVINLTELNPELTVNRMGEALIEAFREAYGSLAPVEESVRNSKESRAILEELYCKYSSWAWRYGEAPKFDVEMETRFPWGGVTIGFKLENGLVSGTTVYSDALDEAFIAVLPQIFSGCSFHSQKLAQRLQRASEGLDEKEQSTLESWELGMENTRNRMMLDIAEWIESKNL